MWTLIPILLCVQTIQGFYFPDPTFTGETVRNELLARKMEKLLQGSHPKLYEAKEEIEKQIEYNFLRTLAAFVVSGPMMAQEREMTIVELMQSTVNGELDFKPVVQKLPSLFREKGQERLTMVIKTVHQTERKGSSSPSRQLGGLQNMGKILEAMSKINAKEIGGFLKEIPEIFEGVGSIIDGVDEYF